MSVSKSCLSALRLKPLVSGLDFGLSFIETIDSRLACQAERLLRKGDHLGYLNLKIDPEDYQSPSHFAYDYAALEILSKFPFLNLPGVDRKAVAMQKFWESEEDCRITNARLQADRKSFASVLFTAQRKIANCLGEFSWNEAEVGFSFGPGATTRLRRIHGDVYYKLQDVPDTTANNFHLAQTCLRRVPRWLSNVGSRPLNIVAGNKVTTVAKNAKTDRTIAIEPCMNMYVQKGIGSLIRGRLKRVGVNLDDQTRNQRLAKEGSITGQLATLDLSSASDSVASGLVFQLLPPDWFDAMNLCRSHRGVLDGKIFSYHKFSSMGNGFTFELESLIFWALTEACCEARRIGIVDNVGIYGDDIIVPVDAAELLIEVLRHTGFKTNVRKTFIRGPFRESCGKHYFRGVDVTPIFFRKELDSVESLVCALNSLRRFSASRSKVGCDGRFKHVWEYYSSFLGPEFPFRTPLNLGDVGLIVNRDEAHPDYVFRKGRDKRFRHWDGISVLGFQRSREIATPQDGFALLAWLFRADKRKVVSDSVFGVPTPRERLKPVKLTVLQWDDLGPWY